MNAMNDIATQQRAATDLSASFEPSADGTHGTYHSSGRIPDSTPVVTMHPPVFSAPPEMSRWQKVQAILGYIEQAHEQIEPLADSPIGAERIKRAIEDLELVALRAVTAGPVREKKLIDG